MTVQLRKDPWLTGYTPPRQAPITCRCGADMTPSLDVARRWQFTDDLQPGDTRKTAPTWIDDYSARSWDCPSCGRRLDRTQCWMEPIPLHNRTGATP
jgi:hypothetical protein